jgi:hypothetical protein
MPLKDWFRRVFSSESRDDEAAEREEYGAPGEGEAEHEPSLAGSQPGLYGEDAAETARAGLAEFERPPDWNP